MLTGKLDPNLFYLETSMKSEPPLRTLILGYRVETTP